MREVDLNHRPLGYEPKRSMLSPVDSVTLPRFQPLKMAKIMWILHASCMWHNQCFPAPARQTERGPNAATALTLSKVLPVETEQLTLNLIR